MFQKSNQYCREKRLISRKNSNKKCHFSVKAWIYSNDNIYPNSNANSPFVVLYSKLGTHKFADFHLVLVDLAKAQKIQYVFRHFDRESKNVSVARFTIIFNC